MVSYSIMIADDTKLFNIDRSELQKNLNFVQSYSVISLSVYAISCFCQMLATCN